ncbi:glutamyl-tRNA reductase [Novispirillum sp. DQ9]|uniref:glutamyl-tRNA reductase n=1 Tax=Novispirillum sp. DQ9 TaxID=3398612 RepID=UPI003C79D73A
MGGRAVDRLLIVGANHRSSPLGLRDALFVEDAEMPSALAALRDAGLTEAMLLATCDRVEVIAAADDTAAAAARALAFLAARAGAEPAALGGRIYALTGAEAVRHLFAVASALDSLMIGEPHILGQVKAAHRLCRDAALSGPDLEACLQAAYGAAKRVRTETAVAEGPVSVASSATQTARDLFGDLVGVRVLHAAGGAEMGDLVVESLLAGGARDLRVTARRPSRAEHLARTLGGHVLPFDAFARGLVEAEVVVTGIGGRTWAVTEEAVKAALKARRQRPILFIDAGIPGDVEPVVDRIDNAFLYDLEDLERVAEQGRAGREAAARAAWAILAEEVETFLRTRAERSAVPAIAALHRRVEAERARALAEAGGDAERATRLLAGRLLHEPTRVLRDLAAADDMDEFKAAEALVRRLFGLDDEESNG